jgi:hypothetical protein
VAPIPQHSSRSNEHYSPKLIVEPAGLVLEEIDIDPATCEFANELVGAKRIYTKRDNGLSKDWLGHAFVNPPGGALPRPAPPRTYYLGRKLYANPNIRSRAALWWLKLVNEWLSGRTTEAIFVGFSLELVRSAQVASGVNPLDFPCCFPRARIKFDRRKGSRRVAGRSPTNGNIIVYLPRHLQVKSGLRLFERGAELRFKDAFEPLGRVIDTETWRRFIIGGGSSNGDVGRDRGPHRASASCRRRQIRRAA